MSSSELSAGNLPLGLGACVGIWFRVINWGELFWEGGLLQLYDVWARVGSGVFDGLEVIDEGQRAIYSLMKCLFMRVSVE